MVGDPAVRNISLIWKRNKAENLYSAIPNITVSATFEGDIKRTTDYRFFRSVHLLNPCFHITSFDSYK